MPRSALAISGLLIFGNLAISNISAAATPTVNLDRGFAQTVQPFLASYCIGCHSGKTPAAQFDLGPYTSTAAVIKDYAHWNTVLDRLTAADMPPKAVKQPPPEARQAVIDWIRAMRTSEAQKNAGDPGVVLARRLSNAEYNYTIRDLTGVDIRPTREFPVDPANTAGFDNSGESLTMSPALLNKYLQAAREVANHMVLTPDGFDFAPHTMLVETDREKYAIKRIVDFYERQPTDYADYFEAAWRYRPPHKPGRQRVPAAGPCVGISAARASGSPRRPVARRGDGAAVPGAAGLGLVACHVLVAGVAPAGEAVAVDGAHLVAPAGAGADLGDGLADAGELVAAHRAAAGGVGGGCAGDKCTRQRDRAECGAGEGFEGHWEPPLAMIALPARAGGLHRWGIEARASCPASRAKVSRASAGQGQPADGALPVPPFAASCRACVAPVLPALGP